MNQDIANQIYDLLVTHCGAYEEWREQFVIRQVEGTKEYRLISLLGFGGKFRIGRTSWYVDCYPEDMTDDRHAMIRKTNEALRQLLESVIS